MDKYVIVDLETTGQSPSKGDRIIEVGLMFVENGKITDQYSSFVNPSVEISPFITNLTGISNEHVAGAPTFKEVAQIIRDSFEDAYFVAHNVQFDYNFLNYALIDVGLPPITNPVIDTVELARILLPGAPGYKLNQLAEYFDITHDDPHRASSDAYVTAELLLKLIDKAKGLPVETLELLKKLEPKFKSQLFTHFSNWIDHKRFSLNNRDDLEIYRGLALKKIQDDFHEENEVLASFSDFADDLLADDGFLSKELTGYEPRTGQREMTEVIFDAFTSKHHALIEAETGTGKSLSYLIPSVFHAIKNEQRVMISTHTTQLQSQLLEKEIPLLKKCLPLNIKVALIKGKHHYISLEKFEQEVYGDVSEDNYDVVLTKAIILIWLTETESGDQDEIQLPSSGKLFWKRISAEAEEPFNPASPWFSRTFYQRARKKAQKAHIIITNHALLCTDMIKDYQLLPSYEHVIIDEAHHLEPVASKHFGLKLDYVSLQYLFNEVGSIETGGFVQTVCDTIDDRWDSVWELAKEEADEMFRHLFTFVVKQRQKDISLNDIGRYQYRIKPENETSSSFIIVKEMAQRLMFQIRDLIHYLWEAKKSLENNQVDPDVVNDVDSFIDRLQKIIDDVESFLLIEQQTEVKWIEIEAYGAKNAVYLYSEPIQIAPMLKTSFFDAKKSVVLTSATLTMKNSFSFIRQQLGIEKETVLEKKIDSPFNYSKQVQLLIPNDFPNIKYGDLDDFIIATCEAIYSLARVTKGRMLVLFTSYDMLKKAYAMIKEIIEQDEFILIAQGISSGSRSRLKKNFQAFDQAILFGTSSFWEGVDIPGDDLTSLVIVRLPFQPPDHPVYEAKSEKLKSDGKNAFMELSLPQAVIRFKQGFGRLIRSSSDRGIVFVCDHRMMTARYGKYFTESIPKVPIHYQSTHQLINKAEEWL